MPRRPIAAELDVDPTDAINPEEIAQNDPPAPVQRTPAGEPVKSGVVHRVGAAPKLSEGEFTPAEREALARSQMAPVKPEPAGEDLEEIPGLTYAQAMQALLNGLIAKEGWSVVSADMFGAVLSNGPRFYRALRLLVRRGIYGERIDKGMLTPKFIEGLIG